MKEEIIKRLTTIGTQSIIGISINQFLKSEKPEIKLHQLVGEIKEQINDNPDVMKKILNHDNYTFFKFLNIRTLSV